MTPDREASVLGPKDVRWLRRLDRQMTRALRRQARPEPTRLEVVLLELTRACVALGFVAGASAVDLTQLARARCVLPPSEAAPERVLPSPDMGEG